MAPVVEKKCRVCRNRLHNTSVCTRCGTDYSLADAAEAQAVVQLAQVASYLYRNNHVQALRTLDSLQRLKKNPALESLQQYLRYFVLRPH